MAMPKAGADVDTQCSRCQLELAHVIVAVAGPRIARVQCKTCGSVHAFRGGAAAGSKATRSTVQRGAAAPRGRAAAAIQDYEQLIAGKDLSRAQKYKPSVTFKAGEVLHHPTFGFGVVTKLLADQKLEAMFQPGIKVLVHAR